MNIPSIGNSPANGFAPPRPAPTERGSAPSATGAAATLGALSASATQANNVSELALQATNEVQPSRQELDKAVKAVNEFVGSVNNSLKFSVDEDTGQTVVKVIDNATKEVIKQVPSKEMLEIAKALDNLKGLLVQQKA